MVRIKNFLKNLFTVKWLGRIAILGWIIFGISHYCGITASPVSVPRAVVQQSATQTKPAVQPPAPSWTSRDECERYYVLTLHEAPGNRCK